MKGFKAIIGPVLLIILSGNGSAVFAQKAQDFLNKLKVGEWVEIEGVPQEDFTILLTEIKVIYGEFEDDDWEISGTISGVVAEEKKIFIVLLPIKFGDDTEYKHKKDDPEGIKSFSDIKPGTFVEIEGSFLDSTFLAAEIGPEKVVEDKKNMIEWKGKVQAVNPASNSFSMLGHNIIFTPETKIKSLIHN